MTEEIHAAYAEYSEARRRLIDLSPCPKCCPAQSPCEPGERLVWTEIRRCNKCGGDGFVINWEDEE